MDRWAQTGSHLSGPLRNPRAVLEQHSPSGLWWVAPRHHWGRTSCPTHSRSQQRWHRPAWLCWESCGHESGHEEHGAQQLQYTPVYTTSRAGHQHSLLGVQAVAGGSGIVQASPPIQPRRDTRSGQAPPLTLAPSAAHPGPRAAGVQGLSEVQTRCASPPCSCGRTRPHTAGLQSPLGSGTTPSPTLGRPRRRRHPGALGGAAES